MKSISIVTTNYITKRGRTPVCCLCGEPIMGEHVFASVPFQINGVHACNACYDMRRRTIVPSKVSTKFRRKTNNCKGSYDVRIIAHKIDKLYFLLNGFEVTKNGSEFITVVFKGACNDYLSHVISEVFERTNYKVEVKKAGDAIFTTVTKYDDYRNAVMNILGTKVKSI